MNIKELKQEKQKNVDALRTEREKKIESIKAEAKAQAKAESPKPKKIGHIDLTPEQKKYFSIFVQRADDPVSGLVEGDICVKNPKKGYLTPEAVEKIKSVREETKKKVAEEKSKIEQKIAELKKGKNAERAKKIQARIEKEKAKLASLEVSV